MRGRPSSPPSSPREAHPCVQAAGRLPQVLQSALHELESVAVHARAACGGRGSGRGPRSQPGPTGAAASMRPPPPTRGGAGPTLGTKASHAPPARPGAVGPGGSPPHTRAAPTLRGDGAPGGGFRAGLGAQQRDAQQHQQQQRRRRPREPARRRGGHGRAEGARAPCSGRGSAAPATPASEHPPRNPASRVPTPPRPPRTSEPTSRARPPGRANPPTRPTGSRSSPPRPLHLRHAPRAQRPLPSPSPPHPGPANPHPAFTAVGGAATAAPATREDLRRPARTAHALRPRPDPLADVVVMETPGLREQRA